LANAAELKRITRPLLARDPRLVLVKRTIVVQPVGHFLHGFAFRVTRSGSVDPVVTLFEPLYVPRRPLSSGSMPEFYLLVDRHRYGHLFPPSDLPRFWRAEDPGVEQVLIEELGGDRLDSLLRIDTPDRFLVWADHLGTSRKFVLFSHALAGRLSRAIGMAECEIADWGRRRDVDPGYKATIIRHLRRLVRIFESGQTRTNRLLRTFEEINARRAGVEGWWRWSPVVE